MQVNDLAPVKANASLDSHCEKQAVAPPILTVADQRMPTATLPTAAPLSAPAHQLRCEAARKAKHGPKPGALGKRPKARLVSNKTYYSLNDLKARISIKPGKARALNYLCSLVMDPAK